MVKIRVRYEGDLHCVAEHGPSGTELATDAPKDNEGLGGSFSPTDLVATALGSCMLTIMGIVARRHEWDLSGAEVEVEKVMVADPERRIGELRVHLRIPRAFEPKVQSALERAALTCPVHRTLGSNVRMPVDFHWG